VDNHEPISHEKVIRLTKPTCDLVIEDAGLNRHWGRNTYDFMGTDFSAKQSK